MRPVQLGIAVVRKPATTAAMKPNSISWTCQSRCAASSEPERYIHTHSGADSPAQKAPSMKNGRKPWLSTAGPA